MTHKVGRLAKAGALLLSLVGAACGGGESGSPASTGGTGGAATGGGGSSSGGQSAAGGSGGSSTAGGASGTGATGSGGQTQSAGPLRVSPTNPRYFTDDTGRTIHLAGHQIFVDLQDNSFNKATVYGSQKTLDWPGYLDFANERKLNFIRNWIIWSYGSGSDAAKNEAVATPMMYARTGPGKALDGGPKFDLDVFDESFFQRLHQRVSDAGKRGIYVSIMLFEVYGFGKGEASNGQTLWDGNVFKGENNTDGIDVDTDGNGWGIEFFYTNDQKIRDLQKAYVRKVIDSVNDLDNIMYEVANELYAPSWQAEMIDYIHDYEAGLPKQHLVYMSPGGRNQKGTWTNLDFSTVANSKADCYGVQEAWGDFTDPPVSAGKKPVIWDNDHIWVDGWDNHSTPWKAFTRGYHYVLYDHPFEKPLEESAEWELMRYNTGATNEYAERVPDLAALVPHGELSTTGYCLADPGTAYVVYQPSAGKSFEVKLEAGSYQVEWFDAVDLKKTAGDSVTSSGGSETFKAPSSGDAVLYLEVKP